MSSLMQPRRRLDRRDIMRLMQRRKWNEFAQTRDDRRIDQDGGGKTASTMDHMVPRGAQMICGELLFEPFQQGGKRRLMRFCLAKI